MKFFKKQYKVDRANEVYYVSYRGAWFLMWQHLGTRTTLDEARELIKGHKNNPVHEE